MIAVDGPAPLAKLITQRERRKKTGRSVSEGETLTGAAITPGTTFMLDLTHSLTYFCCVKMSSRRFRHLVFELSDGTVKGEGEVKVLGRLARHWYPEDPEDTHVILGDDADLVLMALTSYKENLYVANSGLNDGRLDRRTPVFSVNLLHQQWAAGMLAEVVRGGQVPLPSALLHAKLDLTLIAILSKGNDYLPGAKGVALDGSGRSGLWRTYQRAVSSPTSACPLGPRASLTLIDPATGTPMLDAAALAALLKLAGVGGGGGGGGGAGGGGRDAEDVAAGGGLAPKPPADPRVYLYGCVWLLTMYLTGQCPDYRFYYDGLAPTASSLRAACEAAVAAGNPHLSLASFGPTDPRATMPLLPVACALALLPANCRHLAAPCVRHLMDGGNGSSGSSQDDVAGTSSDEGSGNGNGRSIAVVAVATAAATATVTHQHQPQQPHQHQALDGDVYELLYGECTECLHHSSEAARLQRLVASTKQAVSLAAGRLDAVQRGTAPVGEPDEQQLQRELSEAEAKYEAAKSQARLMEQRRRRHITSAHPYRRFPVEKLEQVAEAVLAARPISPGERPATAFGRPLLLRAFDSKPEAASFVRSASAPNLAIALPHQHQQHRNASSMAHLPSHPQRPHQHQQRQSYPHQQQQYQQPQLPPRSSDFALLFVPPPPPFKVDRDSYFAAMVRQEVLYDEYDSGRPLQLRLAPPQQGEAVQYLLSSQLPDAYEMQKMAAATATTT
ncbi:hypothetical protein Agub_g14812, partial [Astrephomene gubernaculifera]